MTDEIENKIDNDLCDGSIEGCNGGDKFRTAPCPIHFNQEDLKNKKKFGEDVNTITDLMMIPERMRTWEGFVFQCPTCKKDSVMVNQDMAPNGRGICSNSECGKKAIIQSKIITVFINQLSMSERK